MTSIAPETDFAVEHGVAVVTLDYPPVNAMSPALIDGLYDAIMAALSDDAVAAIVLICAGRTFIAGADLKSLGKATPKVDFFALQDAIENSGKPTIAAIHGTALGGGLETALTFHYRIAVPSARMGLPEATLGLLPGGGGTQRLPRITGAEAALDLLISGRHVPAGEALAIGLVDRLAAEGALRDDAVAFARELVAVGAPPQRIRDAEGRIARDRADGGIVARYAASHGRALRGLDAPLAILRCVEAAVAGPWEAGLAVERAEFQTLLAGPQSVALRHVFMAERAAQKIPGSPATAEPVPIRAAAVVGAGPAGRDVALALLRSGVAVTLADAVPAALEEGLAALRDDIASRPAHVGAGRAAPGDGPDALAGTTDLQAIAGADLVAVASGDGDAGRALVARLDGIVAPGALIAMIPPPRDLAAVADASRHPERIVGMSLAAHAAGSRLIEVVRHAGTGDAALATAMTVGKRSGRATVAVRAAPIADRMLAVLRREAETLVSGGSADAGTVDRLLVDFGFGTSPLAPCGAAAAGDAAAPPAPGDAETLDRLIVPVIAEGARLLEEGVAARGSDIDLVWVAGLGWPAHIGGPMFHADRLGLGHVVDRLDADGHDVPALLRRLARDGGSLSAYVG